MDWAKLKFELENTSKDIIGKRVKELRDSKSLSQTGLAELLNIDQSTISAIESGKKSYSERRLFEIAMEFHDPLGLNSINDYFEKIFNLSFDILLERKIREIVREELKKPPEPPKTLTLPLNVGKKVEVKKDKTA